jgi:hypothetical protein
MKITKEERYRTVSGLKVTIYAILEAEGVVHGAVVTKEKSLLCSWSLEGKSLVQREASSLDLVIDHSVLVYVALLQAGELFAATNKNEVLNHKLGSGNIVSIGAVELKLGRINWLPDVL